MRRCIRLLAPALALALVATACGDDEPQPAMSGDVPADASSAGDDETSDDETSDDETTDDRTTDDTTAADAEASASFSAPEDGATVARRFTVAMAAEGVEIEPAGEMRDGAGHFHVMIDADCVEPGQTIPKDDQHVHFGDGSTTAEFTLEPGEHTLCLQVGDGAHVALPLTHTVKLTVA